MAACLLLHYARGAPSVGALATSSWLRRSGVELLPIMASHGDTPDDSGQLDQDRYGAGPSVLGSLSTAARPLGAAGPDGRHRSGQWTDMVWPLCQSDRGPARRGRAHHPPVFSPDWQRRLPPEGMPAVLTGTVTDDGLPQLLLTVAGQSWPATIDTGFNGALELPNHLRQAVNARFIGRIQVALGGGQHMEEDLYLVDFPFDGEILLAEATFVPGQEILLKRLAPASPYVPLADLAPLMPEAPQRETPAWPAQSPRDASPGRSDLYQAIGRGPAECHAETPQPRRERNTDRVCPRWPGAAVAIA